MIVNKNASLKKLNTFNVDASCDVLVESSNTNDLLEVLKNKELNNKLFILGDFWSIFLPYSGFNISKNHEQKSSHINLYEDIKTSEIL